MSELQYHTYLAFAFVEEKQKEEGDDARKKKKACPRQHHPGSSLGYFPDISPTSAGFGFVSHEPFHNGGKRVSYGSCKNDVSHKCSIVASRSLLFSRATHSHSPPLHFKR